MALDRHLVAFARAPRIGRVKRRLAADIGAVAAWQFYRQTLQAVLTRLDGGGQWRRWLAITPDAAVGGAGAWPSGWKQIAQGGGDLGMRMERVMAHLPPGPAVIIGTDVPELGPRHVAAAFRALGDHDAAIGPAADGGYWLIGLKRRPHMSGAFGPRLPGVFGPRLPGVFENVRWSSSHTLADTLAALDGLDVAVLDTLDDVDDGADLARWRRRHGRMGNGDQ